MLIVFLSALIFYGGAGVNFISYCCNECRSAGVEAVVSEACCDIHEHQHGGCDSHSCGTDCCTLERIDFDWERAVGPVFKLQPTVMALLSACTPAIALLPGLEITETLLNDLYDPCLVICPKVYLSLLTTLLI